MLKISFGVKYAETVAIKFQTVFIFRGTTVTLLKPRDVSKTRVVFEHSRGSSWEGLGAGRRPRRRWPRCGRGPARCPRRPPWWAPGPPGPGGRWSTTHRGPLAMRGAWERGGGGWGGDMEKQITKKYVSKDIQNERKWKRFECGGGWWKMQFLEYAIG